MSIIKRKAGSEDIVKSVLEFDDVPTDGSHNLVESGAVAQAIGNLGKPLQWKGPATVAQLNAGITGIQEGWTYTLTDAGTLTDGSITVDVGDEVAWTEDGEWFKVGGDSGKVAVFYVTFSMGQKVYPDPDEILAAINAGKFAVIDEPNQGVWEHTFWLLQRANQGPQNHIYFEWKDRILVAEKDNTAETPVWTWFEKDIGFAKTGSIAPDYTDLTFPVDAGTACMHDGLRYVASTTISTAEAWTAAHWAEKSVESSLLKIKWTSAGSWNNKVVAGPLSYQGVNLPYMLACPELNIGMITVSTPINSSIPTSYPDTYNLCTFQNLDFTISTVECIAVNAYNGKSSIMLLIESGGIKAKIVNDTIPTGEGIIMNFVPIRITPV